MKGRHDPHNHIWRDDRPIPTIITLVLGDVIIVYRCLYDVIKIRHVTAARIHDCDVDATVAYYAGEHNAARRQNSSGVSSRDVLM